MVATRRGWYSTVGRREGKGRTYLASGCRNRRARETKANNGRMERELKTPRPHSRDSLLTNLHLLHVRPQGQELSLPRPRPISRPPTPSMPCSWHGPSHQLHAHSFGMHATIDDAGVPDSKRQADISQSSADPVCAEPSGVRGRLVARERLYEPIMGKRPRRPILRTARGGHTIPRSRRTDVRHGSRQHPLADSWTGGHHGPALSRSKGATDSHS
ncbi:hypothetical protein F5144DRAFT_198533 [Chaetomium tenue]|uniref:Uncharacterized protein n=1 Tax=Chaetomium tenue TaxID=1854479 RepID=A0ACB7PCD2_9PEZI|nr:hypothetical protein F5144DRAFT_198533 [Chaetomium globosum]